ncbi:hypothetical protein J6590_096631 [Homalodisca vitripennis]|nr:hypothetical protein J6590_096631 [Homalodisca vitripennis]
MNNDRGVVRIYADLPEWFILLSQTNVTARLTPHPPSELTRFPWVDGQFSTSLTHQKSHWYRSHLSQTKGNSTSNPMVFTASNVGQEGFRNTPHLDETNAPGISSEIETRKYMLEASDPLYWLASLPRTLCANREHHLIPRQSP